MGWREWKPVPPARRELFWTINPVKARASHVIPRFGARLLLVLLLPRLLVHVLQEAGSVRAGEDEFGASFESVRLQLYFIKPGRRGRT